MFEPASHSRVWIERCLLLTLFWLQYYVARPTTTNSLIGTSAFILASLEIERLT
jgi:hypothetical protein